MEYTIKLTDKELESIAMIMQEWPYRIVKPILENIWQQIDEQNKKLQDLTSKQE